MYAMLTIGQLAKQVGVRTSTLRYYEKEGLLEPNGRSESGYRFYAEDAIQTIRLIQRAQRLGFSLADIRPLLQAWETGDLSDAAVVSTAENRYLALEAQITRLLVQQHELEHFLQDLDRRAKKSLAPAPSAFDQLLTRVCADPTATGEANFMFDWLLAQAGCSLTTAAGQQILERLRGQHMHVWQEDEAYYILIVGGETAVVDALQELAQLETDCEAHAQSIPEVITNEEGALFIARSENAFIYARLFLALENT